MRKLSELFTKDLGWKFVSLLTAIIFWFVAVNETNPMQNETIARVLVILNKEQIEENNLVLLNEHDLMGTRIDMRIRGSWSDITQLKKELNKNSNAVRAYIDFKPIDISRSLRTGEALPLTVKYSFSDNLNASRYEVLTLSPSTVDIVLDNYITRMIPVTVNRLGDAKEGYVSLQPVVDPAKVAVSGAKSIVDTIDTVRTEVDLYSASDDVVTFRSLMVYDKNGGNITNRVSLEKRTVQIRVPIDMVAQIPISRPTITGSLMEGYRIADIDWSPKYVEVVGDRKDVEQLASIELEPINIDNLASTRNFTIDLRSYLLNTNLSVKNGSAHETTITVQIEKEVVRELAIPVKNLVIKGDATYEISSEEVQLLVRGGANDVNALEPDKIVGHIDLSEAALGKNEVPIDFVLPSDIIQLVDTPMITVMVLDDSELDDGEINSNQEAEPTDAPEVENGEMIDEPTVDNTTVPPPLIANQPEDY